MRLPINLASEPFRRDRPVLVVTSAGGIVLLLLFGLLTYLVVSERSRMAETRLHVDRLNAQLSKISGEQAQLDVQIRQPANAEVLDRSVFLNALVERKSVRWAGIFADLESVLPHNVRVMQVRLPQLNSRNEVTLDMIIGTQDPVAVIDLLNKLQDSPLFGPATLHNSVPPTQNEPLYRYRVSVNYAQKL